MEGKDAIIEKIISDANAQAEAILADATAYGEKIVGAAQTEAKAAVADAQANAEKSSLEYIARRMTVCELDIKKIKLAAKKHVIDEVFDRAVEKLKALDGDTYKKVVTGMLKASAEDGDVITVAKDEKIINATFLANYQKQTGVKLTLDRKTAILRAVSYCTARASTRI
jgi:Archaeal/vacuolar-type H+-ATPase subunit E